MERNFSKVSKEDYVQNRAVSGIEALWNLEVSKEVKETIEVSKQLKGKGFKKNDS